MKKDKGWIAVVGALLAVACLALAGVFWVAKFNSSSFQAEEIIAADQAKDIMVYFAETEDKFIDSRIQIDKRDSLEKQIIKILKKINRQAKKKEAVFFWPDKLQVRSAYLLENGLLILDFEKQVKYNQNVDTLGEVLTVRSLVKTFLENFKDIKQIQFLVGGQETDTLAGHVDISEPWTIKDLTQ